MKIGKAKYEKKVVKKYFSIKDGDNVYRILPPIKSLADSGKWAKYYSVHFGYFNSEKKMRPFASPEFRNPKTKIVEVRDAAKERILQAEAMLAKAKADGDVARVKALEEFLDKYNLDSHWYVNAMNEAGEIGLLKIRHKAKLALDSLIKKLDSEGIDPLSVDNGRFFVFTRSGHGRDTVYSVSVKKQKEHVPGLGVVEREVPHVLDEATLKRLETEAFDLGTIFKVPTEEEVVAIVEGDKNKDYSAIDRILGTTKSSLEESEEEEEVLEEESSSTASVSVSATSAASTTESESGGNESVKESVSLRPSPVVPNNNMSNEEWLKSIGL